MRYFPRSKLRPRVLYSVRTFIRGFPGGAFEGIHNKSVNDVTLYFINSWWDTFAWIKYVTTNQTSQSSFFISLGLNISALCIFAFLCEIIYSFMRMEIARNWRNNWEKKFLLHNVTIWKCIRVVLRSVTWKDLKAGAYWHLTTIPI